MTKLVLFAEEGEPNPKYKKILVTGLLSHHSRQGHTRKSKTFSVFLLDEAGRTLGGIIVTFLWNGMEINSLWVSNPIRNQGWGTKLMNFVEKEALKRKCTVAYTNTFPWQAPGFYEKLGYRIYGNLPDFPRGSSLTYYFKQL